MKCYIYALVCPTSGDIRYIGKAKHLGRRLLNHLSAARRRHDRTDHCVNWIRSLLTNDLRPSMIIVAEVPDGEDWQRAEIDAIAAYRAMGCRLTNSTSGGDGTHDLPPDVIAKLQARRRETLKDPVHVEGMRQRLIAQWKDPENRSKFMAALCSEENRKRIAECNRLRFADPIKAAEHSEKMRQLAARPGINESRSDKMKAEYADPVRGARRRAVMANPEVRQKISESTKRTRSTPEERARLSGRAKEAQSRPEMRAYKSAAMKEWWSDPANNKRMRESFSDHVLTINGRTQSVVEWSRESGTSTLQFYSG